MSYKKIKEIVGDDSYAKGLIKRLSNLKILKKGKNGRYTLS
jgi:hypothetical protein